MIVDDTHFEFLRIQRGAIADRVGDRAAWQAAYEQSLADDFASMAPFLPQRCGAVLDIGSGLGGINVLLDRHFGGGLQVLLFDGQKDEPIVRSHNRTFNNYETAVNFLERNGVYRVDGPVLRSQKVDLVISLQAWCFHFAPAPYLEMTIDHCNPGAVIIVDVRRDKAAWLDQLCSALDLVDVALQRPKFRRMVFRAKA